MKTLFAKTFFGITFVLVMLSAVLSLLFYLGVQQSVAAWNVNRTRHLQSTVSQQILRVNRREGRLPEESIASSLDRFLTPGISVAVLTPDRRPVFLYDNGERLETVDPAVTEPVLEELGRTRNPALAVFDQDRIIAYVSVDSLDFRSDLSNRQFLNSIVLSIVIAIVLALVLALIVAYLISRRLTSKARALAVGLSELAHGNRSVIFASSGADELQRIAEAARALQGQLKSEEQMRKQWMQDIAHDLRTPVTALSSQLEGMIEGVLDPTRSRLESIFQELSRVDALVRNLRELSRVESPELSLEWKPVHLDQLIRTAVDRLHHRPDADGSEWEIHAESTAIMGDPEFLLRSMTNLLENAVVHGDNNQPISVGVSRGEEITTVRITNRGWIPEKDRPHLFDRLYRGDQSRSTTGSGLGLAITRAIVNRHNGTVSITQEGDHVVVIVEFPVR